MKILNLHVPLKYIQVWKKIIDKLMSSTYYRSLTEVSVIRTNHKMRKNLTYKYVQITRWERSDHWYEPSSVDELNERAISRTSFLLHTSQFYKRINFWLLKCWYPLLGRISLNINRFHNIFCVKVVSNLLNSLHQLQSFERLFFHFFFVSFLLLIHKFGTRE